MVGFGSDCGVCQNRHRAAAGTAVCDKTATARLPTDICCALMLQRANRRGFVRMAKRVRGRRKLARGFCPGAFAKKYDRGFCRGGVVVVAFRDRHQLLLGERTVAPSGAIVGRIAKVVGCGRCSRRRQQQQLGDCLVCGVLSLLQQQQHKEDFALAQKWRRVANTWLILPVVICLSQRLSHACLSINYRKVKPRKAHYNSRRFLDLRSTWITVVILELIHAIELRAEVTSAFISNKTNRCPRGAVRLANLNNFADRFGLVPATHLSSVCFINFRC